MVGLVGESPKSWDLSKEAKSAGCHSGSLDVLGHESTKSYKFSARVVSKKEGRCGPPLVPGLSDSPAAREDILLDLQYFQSLFLKSYLGTFHFTPWHPSLWLDRIKRTRMPRGVSQPSLLLSAVFSPCLLYIFQCPHPSTSPSPLNPLVLVQACFMLSDLPLLPEPNPSFLRCPR